LTNKLLLFSHPNSPISKQYNCLANIVVNKLDQLIVENIHIIETLIFFLTLLELTLNKRGEDFSPVKMLILEKTRHTT